MTWRDWRAESKGKGISREQINEGSTTWQNNRDTQQAGKTLELRRKPLVNCAAQAVDGAARWMWSLQGRALQTNQMQSHMGRGAQQEVNSGMLTVLGPGFWLGQQDPVSRAREGTCPLARLCCAFLASTRSLSFQQPAKTEMAVQCTRLISTQDPPLGTSVWDLLPTIHTDKRHIPSKGQYLQSQPVQSRMEQQLCHTPAMSDLLLPLKTTPSWPLCGQW